MHRPKRVRLRKEMRLSGTQEDKYLPQEKNRSRYGAGESSHPRLPKNKGVEDHHHRPNQPGVFCLPRNSRDQAAEDNQTVGVAFKAAQKYRDRAKGKRSDRHIVHQIKARQKNGRDDGQPCEQSSVPIGESTQQVMQGKDQQQCVRKHPELPNRWMLAEDSDRNGPPVLHHYRGAHLDRGLGPVVPEEAKAVRVQWLLGNLLSVIVVKRIVDAEWFAGVQ